jgi:hypothetical protein
MAQKNIFMLQQCWKVSFVAFKLIDSDVDSRLLFYRLECAENSMEKLTFWNRETCNENNISLASFPCQLRWNEAWTNKLSTRLSTIIRFIIIFIDNVAPSKLVPTNDQSTFFHKRSIIKTRTSSRAHTSKNSPESKTHAKRGKREEMQKRLFRAMLQ